MKAIEQTEMMEHCIRQIQKQMQELQEEIESRLKDENK